jgi:hypothetical protein
LRGPAACSTWTPARASAPAAPIAAGVERPRALRAAGHQQRRQVVAQARTAALPSSRRAARSRVAISVRIGRPSVTLLRRPVVPSVAVTTAGRVPGAEPVGQPARGLASCTTIGILRRLSGQVGRRRDVPAEADDGVRPHPVQHRPGRLHRDRSRPGMASHSVLGLRGTRTRGTSSSG